MKIIWGSLILILILYSAILMKKIMSLLLIIGLLVQWSVLAGFSDTVNHPYQDDINQLVSQQVVQGYPGNVFNPDWAITRAEMLKIIMLSADITLSTGSESCFPDIKKGEWFTDYVCTAKTLGIVKWYEDGKFRPNAPVLFSEGLKIGLEGFGITTRQEKRGEAWYEKYMDFVHNNSIFSRYALYPEKGMTRAMMTHLAARIMNQWTQPWTNIRENNSLWCKAPQPRSAPTSVVLNGIPANTGAI